MSASPPDENAVELPDDFFNDLADTEFIEKVVENPSNAVGSDDDEQMARCLAEIEKLQKDIARRKEKILKSEAGLSEADKRKRERRSRSDSRSKSSRDRKRNRLNRSRSRSSSPSFNSRTSKRRHRRSRSPGHSRTKRSTSTHKSLTFLEELEKKFAEQGQAFPEKDLLINQNVNTHAQIAKSNLMITPNVNDMKGPMQMDYGNVLSPFHQQPPQQNYHPPSLVQYPNIPQNIFYGVNPMAVLAGNVHPPPMVNDQPPQQMPQYPPPSVKHDPNAMLHVPTAMNNEQMYAANQNALIERCEQAIKLIRAKDNKVPVMKFLFNRSSMVLTNAIDSKIKSINKSPLQIHSTLNTPFKLNAQPNVQINKVAGIRMLPNYVKDVCTSLGINSTFMFEKLRTKELSNQITDQIKCELDVQELTDELPIKIESIPFVKKVEMSTQTNSIECEKCTVRKGRIMVNNQTQVFLKTSSIGVQTNEKDYREPIVEQLARMTAAQLVAIKDFANIIAEPRPQNSVEMYRIRERMMDIYNLSQRDADAVRVAEEQRLDDPNYIDRLRSRSACSMDRFRDPSPHESSPRSHGSFTNGNANNFGGNFENERYLEEREQRRLMEEREYQMRCREEERIREEEHRERLLEMERQREHQMELEQRLFEERRQEQFELERRERQMTMQQSQQQQPQNSFDRGYNRMSDEPDRQSFNSGQRGPVMHRRGRGAFRDNNWGRGGRR